MLLLLLLLFSNYLNSTQTTICAACCLPFAVRVCVPPFQFEEFQAKWKAGKRKYNFFFILRQFFEEETVFKRKLQIDYNLM